MNSQASSAAAAVVSAASPTSSTRRRPASDDHARRHVQRPVFVMPDGNALRVVIEGFGGRDAIAHSRVRCQTAKFSPSIGFRGLQTSKPEERSPILWRVSALAAADQTARTENHFK